MSEATVKIAAAYLRRSSATAESPGDASREAQEAAVRRLCGDQVVLYVDWGISGRKSDRPEYQRLRKDIAGGRISSICAYSLSRLGRNARELLDFIELAGKHDVPVRTAVESIDTSTAMGRAMLTVMAAFAQLEVEQGMERSAAARAARKSRHDAAGLPMPGSVAPFGWKHVTEDGITRVMPDPDADLDVILDAYTEAGSVSGACSLLEDRGIPAPKGGSRWSTYTLSRIVGRNWPHLLPRRVANGHRVATAQTSLLTKLVRCPHCERFMTPNTHRGQLYCHRGQFERDRHPRYVAAARPIVEFVKSEAALLASPADRLEGESAEAKLAALDEARRRLVRAYQLKALDDVEFELELKALDDRKAEIQDEGITTAIPSAIDWTAPAPDVNEVLRALWRYVELDPATMQPTRAEWVRQEWRS